MDGLVAGIEAGGTKFVCMVGSSPNDIQGETRFPTTTPEETLGHVLAFLKAYQPLRAVGIGTFGPADLNPVSPTYGYITTTPKKGWANVDFAGTVQRALDVPVGFDTDVNIAALGEWVWGSAQGLTDFIYLTIGTGVGGGGMSNGKLMHGLLHPEMGHLKLPRPKDELPEFAGICPYHTDCLEGLASGSAIEARWGQPGYILPAHHPAWQLEASYLGLALHNLICTLSPQRIILSGGVMEQPSLLSMIHEQVRQNLNGYLVAPELSTDIENYIVAPRLGNRAGCIGAMALAKIAYQKEMQ